MIWPDAFYLAATCTMAHAKGPLVGRRWLARIALAGALASATAFISFLAVHVPNVLEIRSLAALGAAGTEPSVEAVSYISEGRRIAADLYFPDEPKGYAVFAHGNRPAGRGHILARRTAETMGRHFVTLAFDFRGYGESERLSGYAPGMTLDFSADIIEGARYLAQRFDIAPEEVILVGHSFGSVSVLRAGQRLDSHLVVPVGTGDVEALFENPNFAAGQVRKLQRIGLDPPLEDVRRMYEPLFARNLFQGCAPARVHLISGARDPGLATLDNIEQWLDPSCERTIERTVIPYANHMFWSERRADTYFRAYSLVIDETDWVLALVGAIAQRFKAEG